MARREIHGTCPTCGETFVSHRPKKFCSVKCRANSPDFKKVAIRNAEKARAARSAHARAKRQRQCGECGDIFEAQPASTQRFCSRTCSRKNRAHVFDDFVAALETVPEMSNFDGYLSQDVLQCPIHGCHWSGENLDSILPSITASRCRLLKLYLVLIRFMVLALYVTIFFLTTKSHI